MQIKIDLKDFTKTTQELKQIKDKLKNTKPLMHELANHIYNISMDSFDYEQDPNAHPWTPLKQATLKQKSNSKMLFDDGDLQRNFTYEVNNKQAIIGTSANHKGYSYPIVHQFGSEKRKIPARAFMPINLNGKLYKKTEEELEKIGINFIKKTLK